MQRSPATQAKRRLLVVDANERSRAGLWRLFTSGNFSAEEAESASAARTKLGPRSHHLCLIDLNLPQNEALALCRYVREELDLGVILVSGSTEVEDRVLGLEMGADDYVTRPFNARELVARVSTVIDRRESPPPQVSSHPRIYLVGEWRFDADVREIKRIGQTKPVPLSTGEHDLLLIFVERPGQLLTRSMLSDLLGAEDLSRERIIDSQVSRLRRKIGDTPDYIKTIRGGGYILSAQVERP